MRNLHFLLTIFFRVTTYKLQGHFWLVVKVVPKFECNRWNSRLESYLLHDLNCLLIFSRITGCVWGCCGLHHCFACTIRGPRQFTFYECIGIKCLHNCQTSRGKNLVWLIIIRRPVGSTDQAYPSCFYFRISWILMERPWF